MKNITISTLVFLFLFSGILLAQKPIEVIGEPEANYGYLIWRSDSTVIKYHHCEIYFHELSGNDTISTMLKKHEIWDRTYLKIDDSQWQYEDSISWYTVKIIGFDSQNQIVDVVDPLYTGEGGPGEFQCDWNCVSSNYAYRIKNVRVGNTYTLSQRSVYEYVNTATGIQVPFYEYFSPSQFITYTNSGQWGGGPGVGDARYHGFPDWSTAMASYSNETTNGIVYLQNASTGNYCDDNGLQIPGSLVWGIKKALWHWWEDPLQTTDLNNDFCTGSDYTFWNIVDMMNNWKDTDQINMVCDANLAGSCGNGVGGGTGGGGVDISDEPAPDCGITFTGSPIGWDSEFECMPLAVQINNNGEVPFGEFLTYTELFQITSLTNGAEVLLNTNGSEILDGDSVPQIPSINLPAGLYRITAKVPNDRLRYMVTEIHENIIFNVPHSSFFNGLIYPNPNTEGFYFIDINTSARLRPLYEVFNAQGIKLYEQYFDLPANHQESHRISPGQFPNGFIYHKFTFADGSHTTYTTVQQ